MKQDGALERGGNGTPRLETMCVCVRVCVCVCVCVCDIV